MVVSQTLPSLEDVSITALACSGDSEPSSASLFPAKISWQPLVLGDMLGAGWEGFGCEDGG
jgi:hypothetical protein